MRSLSTVALAVSVGLIVTAVFAGPAQSAFMQSWASGDARIISLGSDAPFAGYADMCFGAAPQDVATLGGFTKDSTIPPNLQRSLVYISISGVPAGQTIQSATLWMFSALSDGHGNDSQVPMSIYRSTMAWSETEASWNKADATHAWTNGGGDGAGTTGVQLTNPYASSTAAPTSNDVAVTWDVSTLVSQWYSGSFTNFGFLVVSASPNDLGFRSREYNGGALAPRLDITFAPAPEPATMALLLVGGALVGVARRRRGSK